MRLLHHAERGRVTTGLVNFRYGSDALQTLDVCPALGPGLHKMVLFVHGGGWRGGDKQGGHKLAGPLNKAGYTLVTINYRLVPQTDLAGSLGDVANAIAYLLANPSRFGVDPSRFALIGHSSGGHLVALLATDQHYLVDAGVDPRRLAAVIALDGLFDATVKLAREAHDLREAVFGHDPAVWSRYSPIKHIAKMQALPAFGIMHEVAGARFGEQARSFVHALRQHGRDVETAVASGLNHGQLVTLFDTDQPMAPFTLGCLAKSL